MHLEDQLQSIYLKSKLLAEYIKVHRRVFSHELASLHEYVTLLRFVDKTLCCLYLSLLHVKDKESHCTMHGIIILQF